MAYKITATDEQIAAALETLDLPVSYGEVPENEVNDYNFIYYRPGLLVKDSINIFKQTVFIYLVTRLSNLDLEMNLIETLEGIKLKQTGTAQYNRYQLAETNEFINVIAFQFNRSIKRVCD